MNTMRAAVLRNFKTPLSIEDIPVPKPAGESLLVRVKAVGVCHTDLHIQDGMYPGLPLPLVLGHEIAGEVEGLGDVLVYASWGCRACQLCERGDEQLCKNAAEPGWMRDGGFAEYVLVPSPLYLFPLNGLDPVRAAPLADAGVTPFRAVQKVRPWLHPAETTVVIGVGGLGQFALRYLKLLTNSRIVAVDKDPSKLKTAIELGAHEIVQAGSPIPEAQAILDFVGSDETLAMGTKAVKRGGIVVQVGEAGGRVAFGLGHVPHEATLTTSIWGSHTDLHVVLDLARQGRLNWSVETMALYQANAALDRLRRGDIAGRLVLIP